MDAPIHTFKVDRAMFPAVLLYSDSHCQNTLITITADWLKCWLNKIFPTFPFERSWSLTIINFSIAQTNIDGLKFGWSLMNQAILDPSTASLTPYLYCTLFYKYGFVCKLLISCNPSIYTVHYVVNNFCGVCFCKYYVTLQFFVQTFSDLVVFIWILSYWLKCIHIYT